MNYWNYRIVKLREKSLGNDQYEIREVYYDSALHSCGGSEKMDSKLIDITAYSKDAISAYGNTPEELAEDLTMMLRAFQKEVLNETDLDDHLEEIGTNHNNPESMPEASEAATIDRIENEVVRLSEAEVTLPREEKLEKALNLVLEKFDTLLAKLDDQLLTQSKQVTPQAEITQSHRRF